MRILRLAFQNLVHRPLRNILTVIGLAVAIAVLVCLSAFGHGYQRALGAELARMGLQMMLVPLGCPYDAAARVLKGRPLENSLPESALEAARREVEKEEKAVERLRGEYEDTSRHSLLIAIAKKEKKIESRVIDGIPYFRWRG